MKFTPGIMGDGLSGSLGSTCASRNRYGPYLRTKAVPVNPNTTRQQAVRTIFGTLVNNWANVLTGAQRTGWDTYANNTPILDSLGKSITITGQNHYIRSNSPRLQIGQAAISDAPTIFNTGAPVTGIAVLTSGTPDTIGVNLAVDALAMLVDIAGGASDDGDVILQIGAPINITRGFFKGPYQLAASQAIISAAASSAFITLFTALLSDNVDPAVGQNRSVRLRIAYDDGRLSEAYSLLALVEADTV